MTITGDRNGDRNGTAAALAADLAQAMFTDAAVESGREPTVVLAHEAGADLVGRREAFRPVYDAIVARIGAPTLLGGAAYGPSVRWCTRERTLLLRGDREQVALSVHDSWALGKQEWSAFDGGPRSGPHGEHRLGDLPYTWQLDRKGPGEESAWTYNGMPVAGSWEHAESALELMLASWAEQIPVQAPGDWVGFKLWNAREWGRSMILSYTHEDEGCEFHMAIDDRGREQTPRWQARMRERGWQQLDEHGWWRTEFAETDPRAPRALARLAIAEERARGATCPDELRAWDIGAGDDGDLWAPGIGVPTHPSRGEHY